MTKKIVLIIVASITIASVFILGIITAAIEQTIITVQVTGVEFDHSGEEPVLNTDGTTSMILKLADGTQTYQLSWYVYPLDDETGLSAATNPSVFFSSDNVNVLVNGNGMVFFPSSSDVSISVIITIRTSDGDKKDTITLFEHYSGSSEIG